LIDLLPPFQGWDSPKGSARLRGSSARRDAFAWGVRRLPSGYDPRRAFQRVQPGQRALPTQTRRAWFVGLCESHAHHERRVGSFERFQRGGIRSVSPRSGIQPTGYQHPRLTRWPGRGGVGLRLSYPAGCEREASSGVEDPLPRPGNAVTSLYESGESNGLGDNSQPTVDRWTGAHRIGFIPRLKPWVFAS